MDTLTKNFLAVIALIMAFVINIQAEEPDSLIFVTLRPGVYRPYRALHQIVNSPLEEKQTMKIYQLRSDAKFDTTYDPVGFWGWNYQREIIATDWKRIDTVAKRALDTCVKITSHTEAPKDETFPDYRHRLYLIFIGLVSLVVALRFFKLIRQWLYDFLAVILIGNGLMIGLYSLGLRHCPPNLIFSWGTLKVLLLISTLVAGFLIFLIERPLYRSYSRQAADPALELYSAILNWLQIGIVLYAAFFLFGRYWLTSLLSGIIIFLFYQGTKIIKQRSSKEEKRRTQILIKGGEGF